MEELAYETQEMLGTQNVYVVEDGRLPLSSFQQSDSINIDHNDENAMLLEITSLSTDGSYIEPKVYYIDAGQEVYSTSEGGYSENATQKAAAAASSYVEFDESSSSFSIVSSPATVSKQASFNVEPTPPEETQGTSMINPMSATLSSLEEKIGYHFSNTHLLSLALTHHTANRTKCPTKDGERLEILGDCGLGTVILDLLYERNPSYGPGKLTILKSALTCNDTLAVIAVKLGLHTLLQHNLPQNSMLQLRNFVIHQEKNNHLFSHEKQLVVISSAEGERALDIEYPKIYADAFESLIGAIRVDSERNEKILRNVILRVMGDTIVNFNRNVPVCPLLLVYQTNPKIIYKQKNQLQDGNFHVELKVNATQSFQGSGASMKAAKTAASKLAIRNMPWLQNGNSNRKRTCSEGGTSGVTSGKKRKRNKTES